MSLTLTQMGLSQPHPARGWMYNPWLLRNPRLFTLILPLRRQKMVKCAALQKGSLEGLFSAPNFPCSLLFRGVQSSLGVFKEQRGEFIFLSSLWEQKRWERENPSQEQAREELREHKHTPFSKTKRKVVVKGG